MAEMGGHCKTAVKIFIPQRTVMGCSRGKLLGTKGSMLKQLMQEAGYVFSYCRMCSLTARFQGLYAQLCRRLGMCSLTV